MSLQVLGLIVLGAVLLLVLLVFLKGIGKLPRAAGVAVLVVVVLGAGISVWMTWGDVAGSRADTVFPRATDQGFVGSESCRACHDHQHETWHDSYHRTMTQPATPETVVASFDQVKLETDGMETVLFRRGDEFWVDMVDPEWIMRQVQAKKDASFVDNPPRSRHQIVMTTGSHHFQVYWYRSEYGRELWQFPWRYHIDEQRWIHRRDVFLTNERWIPGLQFQVWNRNCILCHCTGGQPGQDNFDGIMHKTQVAELGISCEACHGPGEDHVRLANSLERRGRPPVDDMAIVNPAKLPHELSSQVCGRCHSHLKHTDNEVMTTGTNFRPGDQLTDYGQLLGPDDEEPRTRRYWSDGTNCSGGREFSGMSTSACYLNGEMSCLSCHAMHGDEPNLQLSPKMDGDAACLQCHESMRERLAEHTHHSVESEGSRCYNCHMAYTSFALLKAIRNHRVDTPHVQPTASGARPNACNLCHLDQTPAWAAQHLEEWYGQTAPEMDETDRTVAAGVQWLLRGDPLQRALVAWHFGWEPAQTASGVDWMPAHLSGPLDDRVAAVRWAAGVSLRSLPGFESVATPDDSPEARQRSARQAMEKWLSRSSSSGVAGDQERRASLLFSDDGTLDRRRADLLRTERDDSVFTLVE